jgi:RecA DNA recombination protein
MAIPIASSPPPGWDPRGIDLLLAAFPTGQLSEIVGPRSSGGSSLLLALISRATAADGRVAIVDGADALDPVSAASAGADLSKLLWIKCGGRLTAALRAADLLARCPEFAVVAVDLGELPLVSRSSIPPAHFLRLQRAVKDSPTALVLRAPHRMAGSIAALVVSVRRIRTRWIGRLQPTRLAGFTSEAQVLRSRLDLIRPGSDGCTVEWEL